ncbi:hypothetical protein NPIL_409791 [Nephila pilipes]|uniref:Uncharacterized protein n=1 Tax=Nephila pilipes TaxID=299642 RepID=A0A8X6UAC8_NEPPI|nr:hypothetical protein NPIL_409791 [Nephila pilipes]
MNQILPRRIASVMFASMRSNGEWGSGSGKGGGSGGSVRDAGGSFGKMEAAREEEYFRKQIWWNKSTEYNSFKLA